MCSSPDYVSSSIPCPGANPAAQVFSHLHPTDLLNLAQTSKTFRAFLLGPGARTAWTRALARVRGLPPPPVPRTFPAYSALVFRLRCTVRIACPSNTVS